MLELVLVLVLRLKLVLKLMLPPRLSVVVTKQQLMPSHCHKRHAVRGNWQDACSG